MGVWVRELAPHPFILGRNSNFGPQRPKREDWEAGVLGRREAKAEASVLGLLRVEAGVGAASLGLRAGVWRWRGGAGGVAGASLSRGEKPRACFLSLRLSSAVHS